MARICVTGGRHFDETAYIFAVLDAHHVEVLIHGDCPTGLDHWADEWAKARQIPVRKFPADWDKFGRAAGPIRNQQMVDSGEMDYLLMFPGGRRTYDMYDKAQKAGIPIRHLSPGVRLEGILER